MDRSPFTEKGFPSVWFFNPERLPRPARTFVAHVKGAISNPSDVN